MAKRWFDLKYAEIIITTIPAGNTQTFVCSLPVYTFSPCLKWQANMTAGKTHSFKLLATQVG